MLLGGADDWTPSAPCEALAQASSPPQPEVATYAGAFHGFNGTSPLRVRRDMPNGVRPGQGEHVGGDAAAREAAGPRLRQFAIEAF